MPGEFELIRRYFDCAGLNQHSPSVVLGIGDDCAILDLPAEQRLCFSMDSLVAGVHFPAAADPALIARRALAVNLSDLAAMGASPLCFTLGLTLPEASDEWLQAFSAGLAAEAAAHGVSLVGGDTTLGPLSITLQVQGLLPRGGALRRDGAREGELVIVSGTLGDAAAALDLLEQPAAALTPNRQQLLERYYRPQPRLELGQALLKIGAGCAIDISDGLLADLGHILERSCVGARIDLGALPLSAALRAECPERALERALNGGDDYELCFTLAEPLWQQHRESLCAWVACTPIGRIGRAPGLTDAQGAPLVASGYQHFRGE
ncbi:thiamine-phosphate kinase [Aestuariirhabdus litorea]|uniref:Thiamine-monophosphate kinase n=1 Tax=Aestuariirhabdus litorea TaxID=2528527 RepID=A0A3P3VLH0_9GAMM|nr:thiamine-phosphate kinase [Aestuariirhabdus litorea]RRJ83602.1 thiamine-phosphate kinase [Aestuariirhabdus litorea]RWW96823.1 thiamine-phosphate kinase [Endozoicomonadaceae bacterium GTF-13]